jgi:hypothetical protein
MTKTIVVAADLGKLKAYRLQQTEPSSGPQVRLVQIEITDVIRHLSELVTDRAGQFRKRRSSPAGPNDRSDGEHHNLSLERRRRALKALASDIDELIQREGVESWHLAAGTEINRALVDALDDRTRDKLQDNVQKDLTNLGSDEVLSHFHLREQGKNLSRGAPKPAHIRRKPSARRTNPFKKTMRKQTIGPEVARIMRSVPDKGDRRRSVSQRIARRDVRSKVRQGRAISK